MDQSITTYGELSKDKIQVSSHKEIIADHHEECMHWALIKEMLGEISHYRKKRGAFLGLELLTILK